MDFPQVFIHEDPDDEERAAKELAAQVAALGVDEPFVITSSHGAALTSELAVGRPVEQVVPTADQRWAAELGSRAHRSGADAIVAAGGGRTLDVAKLAAARAGLVVIS